MSNLRDRLFGRDTPCFIVAEISANHKQKFQNAARLIELAKDAGADAVKFQAYTPESMTLNIDSKYFRINHPKWGGQTLFQLYKTAHTPWSWFRRLKKIADGLGIVFFSTSFDRRGVDFLEGLDVPLHKISSFELTDLALISYAARTKKPLILSTGMASLEEIREAVEAAKKNGAKDIMLLKCVSSYPAEAASMNLRTILDFKKRFNCLVGLSDHTLGIAAPVAAVALGAKLIEKHFTSSRKMNTPDSFFSLEPVELKHLVSSTREAQAALGKVSYGVAKDERPSLIFRRSLFAVKNIQKGEKFNDANIRAIRPSGGLKPKYLKDVLGKEAKKKIVKGTPLGWGMIKRK